MTPDYSLILSRNYADSLWVLYGNDPDTLRWDSDTPKPTKATLDAAWPQVRDALAWDAVRVERDRLLAESDWTQVADAPVDAAAWAVYRQALRDVPQNFESPDTVVWPEQP